MDCGTACIMFHWDQLLKFNTAQIINKNFLFDKEKSKLKQNCNSNYELERNRKAVCYNEIF